MMRRCQQCRCNYVGDFCPCVSGPTLDGQPIAARPDEIFRCKVAKPDGTIVDGCGWQGTPALFGVDASGNGVALRRSELECPSCKSVHLRLVQAVVAYAPPPDVVGVKLAGLGDDPAARKAAPMARGLLDYFPNALAYVSHVSKTGNDQHNPGQPMHWAFNKSTDEPDCILRHLAQRGTLDTDGLRHAGKVAWRALALLERELLEAYPDLKPGLSVKGR